MARSVVSGREHLIETMAEAKPEDLLASLGRLIAEKSMSMEEADDLYTMALRSKIVLDAKRAVLHASEEVVHHNVRSIGCMRTLESDAESEQVQADLETAVDNLIVEAQRATVARWKLIVVGGVEHGSQASSR